MESLTEENYIKWIYILAQSGGEVSVSDLAKKLEVKLPTINSMIKKLAAKKIVTYAPYKGIQITEKGKKEALFIIRKHRLAELFLVQVMGLGWEEVHEIAEQLEHVNSPRFYDRIDELLAYPKFDPHGEPIPDVHGRIPLRKRITLHELNSGDEVRITAVANDEKTFLAHLNAKGIHIGDVIKVKKKEPFDGSVTIQHKSKKEIILSQQVAERLLVEFL